VSSCADLFEVRSVSAHPQASRAGHRPATPATVEVGHARAVKSISVPK